MELVICSDDSLADVNDNHRDREYPVSAIWVLNTPSSPKDLGEFAVDRFCNTYDIDIRRYAFTHVITILEQESVGPDNYQPEDSDIAVLRRILSGNTIDRYDNEDRVNKLVIRAMKNAFEEKERILQQKEEDLIAKEEQINKRYSATTTALITGITSLVSTICGIVATWKLS